MNNGEDIPSENKQNDKSELSITSNTPIRLDEFTLGNILDSETIKIGVKAVSALMEQSVENDKAKNELEIKKLSNEIELRNLDIKEQELDIKSEEQEQQYIKWFDIRNKIYALGILMLVIAATIILKSFDILDKNEARTIIVLVFGTAITGNNDFIKNIFKKKGD